MGGPGSGTWYRYSTRETVESCLSFTPRQLQPAIWRVASGRYERGLAPLAWSRGGRPAANILVIVERYSAGVLLARMSYTVTIGGEKISRDYSAPLVSTASNLPGNAGRRWWFICPLSTSGRPCRRRVGVLYSAGGWFGCRHCHNLTYRSCNESHQVERLQALLAEQLAAELGDMSPDDVADALASFDRDTLQLMGMAARLTRQSKETTKLFRKMGL